MANAEFWGGSARRRRGLSRGGAPSSTCGVRSPSCFRPRESRDRADRRCQAEAGFDKRSKRKENGGNDAHERYRPQRDEGSHNGGRKRGGERGDRGPPQERGAEEKHPDIPHRQKFYSP